MTGLQAEGYSVDETGSLERPLTILKVTEEFTGEYKCFISEDPQAMVFGVSHVSIVKGSCLANSSEEIT